MAPGSMTPRATTIEEEGVYIDDFKLVDQGRFLEAETHALLTGAKYPARMPGKNIADLKAHVAANAKGAEELRKMVAQFGLDVVKAYMQHVQDNAEESVRRLLSKLDDGAFRVEMDQGSWVDVKITVDREERRARVDFSAVIAGAGQQLQCAGACDPRGHALRVPRDGQRADSDERGLPQADRHRHPRAVDAEAGLSGSRCGGERGNEPDRHQLPVRRAQGHGAEPGHHEQPHVRQRQVPVLRDHLLGQSGRSRVRRHVRRPRAYDQHAADRPRDPGAALSRAAGAFRYPPRLGRQGQVERGDGTERRIRFLEKMDCAILSSSRNVRPYGLEGGEPGECGENWVRRNDGHMERLQGCDQTVLEPGEAVIVKTPTGGGFGPA